MCTHVIVLYSVIIRKRSAPHPGVVYLVQPDSWLKVKERNTDEVTDIHVSVFIHFDLRQTNKIWTGRVVIVSYTKLMM